MKLRVWAHWTDQQPATTGFAPLPPAPFPASLASYPLPPGGLPQNAGIPVWKPAPPGPTYLPVVAWCELAKQDHIKSANWFGATWPGQPPPPFPGQTVPPSNPNANQGDEGYGSQAIGFRVTKVTLLLYPNVPNSDFVFTIMAPGGLTITVSPPWTGSISIPVAIPFDGKGIWSIEMDRAPTGSSVSAPSLRRGGPTGNTVNEPYVDPYGSNEGVLGVEFEGDEIICPVGTPLVTIGSCEEDSPGSGNLVVPVTLTVTFASPPPINSQLLWTGLPAGITPVDIVTMSQTTFSKAVKYPAGSTQQPTVTLIGTQPTTVCPSVSFGQISVPGCLPCPQLILEDPMERDLQTNLPKHVFGCAGSTARVEFRATINWGAVTSPPPVKYIWTVHTPNGNFEKTIPATTAATVTTNTSAGWEKLPKIPGSPLGPVDLTKAGAFYSVAVSAEVQCPSGPPNSCLPSGCNLLATGPFEIPPCTCPTRVANPYNEWQVVGNITAPLGPNSFEAVDCDKTTATITLTVDRQGLQPSDLKYTWDFGDGTTQGPLTGGSPPTGQNGEKRTHTFINPTPGQAKTYNVEVKVDAPGCTQLKIPLKLTVRGCCPFVNYLSASPSSGTAPLTVNFQANVTNPSAIVPDANGNLYHWDFGDGQTADTTTPSRSHTYGSAGPFTAKVAVNVPAGCAATNASTSITVTSPPGCPNLSGGLSATPSTGTAPLAVNFQVTVANAGAIVPDAQGNLYHWDFGDGTTAHTPTPNTSHTYANAGPFTATVTVNVPPGCLATAASTSITVTGGDGGGGGFSVCCFLIWWWGLSHLAAGSLLYFGNWIAAIISSAVATIVLGIWIAVCCWPCALTFWRCCTLLKWVVMFNDFLVVTLFALFALGISGVSWVILVFGLVSTLVRIAMSASKCGAIPNIFDPTTWPPCRCP